MSLRIADDDGQGTQLHREIEGPGDRCRAALGAADDLDERVRAERLGEAHADDPLGVRGAARELRDRGD